MSFPIPLPAELDESHVHYLEFKEPTAGGGDLEWVESVFNSPDFEYVVQPACSGTIEAPLADPGHLCIYGSQDGAILVSNFIRSAGTGGPGAGTTGAYITAFELSAGDRGHATYAVTAPAE
jgi:hypothetical protein